MGGKQPRRNCMIDGHRYVLGAVNGSWSTINAWAFALVEREYANTPAYRRPSWRGDRGAIWRRKQASEAQAQRWPECKGFNARPNLEWIRADFADAFDTWAEAAEQNA